MGLLGPVRGIRRALVLVGGSAAALVWGQSLWQLVADPGGCGPAETSLAVGGWGLGLVPVHVVSHRAARRGGRQRAGGVDTGDVTSGGTSPG